MLPAVTVVSFASWLLFQSSGTSVPSTPRRCGVPGVSCCVSSVVRSLSQVTTRQRKSRTTSQVLCSQQGKRRVEPTGMSFTGAGLEDRQGACQVGQTRWGCSPYLSRRGVWCNSNFRVAADITFQLPGGWDGGPHSKLSCRACPCLLVAVARLAGRWCSWRWCFSLAFDFFLRFPLRKRRSEDRFFLPQVSPSMFWDFGSLHKKPRVGGPPDCVGRDGSDGWHSPVPGATTLGGEIVYHRLPGSPTDSEHRCESRTVYEMTDPVLPDGCDVAASFLTRCRGSRIFRPCRCGDFGFVSRGPSL